MKICWDNLENVYLTIHGNFRYKHENGRTTILKYFDCCKKCKEPYLAQLWNKGYCSHQCSIKDNETMMEGFGFKNKKHTEESIEKNRQAHLGINTKDYNYPDRSGENNVNWKGGNYCGCGKLIHKQRSRCDECYKISKIETKKRREDGNKYPANWTTITKRIRKRDNYKCQNPYCIERGYVRLEVHHIDYDKQKCNDDNLISLCTKHHAETNFDRDWHQSFYSEIMRRKEKL